MVGHIKRRPSDAPVHSGRLKRADNVKRSWDILNLTWEGSVKKDLKNCSIIKELAMNRDCVEACYSYVRTISWLRDFMGFISLPQLVWD
jgi:hypothetical protein